MNSSTPHLVLRIASYLLALAALAQAVLAGIFLARPSELQELHGRIGMAGIVIALAATVAAFVWMRQRSAAQQATAPARRALGHAAGMTVLAVVQVGLGEAHLEAVHICLGILYVVGAVALAVMVSRRAHPAAA